MQEHNLLHLEKHSPS